PKSWRIVRFAGVVERLLCESQPGSLSNRSTRSLPAAHPVRQQARAATPHVPRKRSGLIASPSSTNRKMARLNEMTGACGVTPGGETKVRACGLGRAHDI